MVCYTMISEKTEKKNSSNLYINCVLQSVPGVSVVHGTEKYNLAVLNIVHVVNIKYHLVNLQCFAVMLSQVISESKILH